MTSESYGRVTSLALDPIEKKPLARFMPRTTVLSLGSYGCNLTCPWCQNASISQVRAADVSWRQISPEEVVSRALDARSRACVGIAYTYNEPFVSAEFMRDCSVLAHDNGLVNVVVSNGMVNVGLLHQLAELIDAANIDLKGFSQQTYDMCSGDFETVKATIEVLANCPTCHLEVTWLVVPGISDDPCEFEAACEWLASVDDQVALHVSRFFPRFKMTDRPATDIMQVYRFAELARKHLSWVYTGNC